MAMTRAPSDETLGVDIWAGALVISSTCSVFVSDCTAVVGRALLLRRRRRRRPAGAARGEDRESRLRRAFDQTMSRRDALMLTWPHRQRLVAEGCAHGGGGGSGALLDAPLLCLRLVRDRPPSSTSLRAVVSTTTLSSPPTRCST